MHRFLLILFWVFLAAYLVALALFLIGTFGLFGQEPSPFSGIYLLPLGLPWYLIGSAFDGAIRPWIAALSPLVNLAIIKWLAGRAAVRGENTGGI